MNTTETKQYLLDETPVTWNELIKAAREVGQFSDPSFQTTSEAAEILRKAGHTVGKNPEVVS